MTPEEQDKLESKILIDRILGTGSNKTPEAWIRDDEREEIAAPWPITDLRSIPLTERANHDNGYVSLPPDIEKYLASAEFPLSPEEVNGIEDRCNAYHNVQAPHAILIDPHFVETGKKWRHDPAVAQTRSCLIYFHKK
jgi:hypothetical protein